MEVIIDCKKCHQHHEGNWADKKAQKLIDNNLCFTCFFWKEIVDESDKPNSVRINGFQYWIGNEEQTGSFRGFAGHEKNIIFNDGREVKTTNLWFNGEIPELFKEELPNNAKWATPTN